MTIRDVIAKIQRHPVVTTSIPLEAQMGYPAALLHGDRLCLHFLYYNTKMAEGKVLLYEPRYSLRTVYPFKHVVKLEDLSYNPKYADKSFSIPVGTIELTSESASKQQKNVDALFMLCDKLLGHCERQEPITTQELEEHRLQLYRTVNSALLQMYKSETE